jgi:hypothetical protein
MYWILVLFLGYFFAKNLFWILHSIYNAKLTPVKSGEPKIDGTTEATHARDGGQMSAADLCEPTHEEILAAMNSNIAAYIDPAMPEFAREYGRTKMRLTPQALKDEKKRRAQERVVGEYQKKLFDLKTSGLTHSHVFGSNVDKTGDRAEVYKNLHTSFCCSGKSWMKHKKDPLREYQPLPQIREGFVTRFNSTGESEATIASLNQMLDEIYALCVTELESKIRAEEEKLSQMM